MQAERLVHVVLDQGLGINAGGRHVTLTGWTAAENFAWLLFVSGPWNSALNTYLL